MPDCDKQLTYYRYRRLSDPKLGGVRKRPGFAPAHAKTDANIRADLIKAIDRDIEARNRLPVPQCGEGCDFIGEDRRTFKGTRTGRHQWTERYQLTDNTGNVVAGVATYSVLGDFELETEVTIKFCATGEWGDEAALRFDPEVDVQVEVAACSGSELFATLSRMREDDRRNLGVSGLTVAKA